MYIRVGADVLALAGLSVVPLVILFKVFVVFINLVFVWRKNKRNEREQLTEQQRARARLSYTIKTQPGTVPRLCYLAMLA